MDNATRNRMRTQLLAIHQSFVDFVYDEKDEKEVVLVKRIDSWIQIGPCKEFSIPVSAIFDKQNYEAHNNPQATLMVKFGISSLLSASIGNTESIVIDLQNSMMENESRVYALDSAIKYATLVKDDVYRENLAQLSNDELCSTIKAFRTRYVTFIAKRILKASESDKSLLEDLRGIGLITVESFIERKLNFIEKLYEDTFSCKIEGR